MFFNIWAPNHWKALCCSTFEFKSLKHMVFFNIWGNHSGNHNGNHNNNNNNNNNGAISQSLLEKWNSYIAFLCAQGCKLRRPTPTGVVGKIKKMITVVTSVLSKQRLQGRLDNIFKNLKYGISKNRCFSNFNGMHLTF